MNAVLKFDLRNKAVCYHRMFEPRKNIDFLSLNVNQFFNSNLQSESIIESFDNAFYVDLKENQLLFSDYIFDLDETTGIFSVQDSRKNIEAMIRILPLRLAKNSIGRMHVHFNSKIV